MKISVLTPSFNTGEYIERAIQSVIAQDYDNWEHIIVDGGSNDNTLDILNRYKHIKWVSEPDDGQSDAMNKAFKICSGDLIVYLNADDELESDIFKEVNNYFNENKDCSILVGNLRVINNSSTNINIPSIKLYEILDLWTYRFPLNPVSYYYRREVQEKIGDFPIDNHYTMDYWFLLHAYKYYTIQKLDQVFGTYHFREDNKSSNAERAKYHLDFVLEEFKREYPIFFIASRLLSKTNKLTLKLKKLKRLLWSNLWNLTKRMFEKV